MDHIMDGQFLDFFPLTVGSNVKNLAEILGKPVELLVGSWALLYYCWLFVFRASAVSEFGLQVEILDRVIKRNFVEKWKDYWVGAKVCLLD